MYILTAISPYLISKLGTYPTIALCEEECERRFNVKGVKFKWSEDAWRAVVAGEEGAIVLKLVEVKDASLDN